MKREEYEKYVDLVKSVDSEGILDRSNEEKYKEFKSSDPFIDIPPALLNSADILKYVLFTGLISDFVCDDLLGATYNCRVSGEYLCFDKEKRLCSRVANDKHDITIAPNSITYVAIKNKFRIPDYIALRFNLRVSHAYKGLLLGTGPLIDPGFVGQIYIPLHNLTSNTYYIRPNAQLISVEFTKLSGHSSWTLDSKKYSKLIEKINSADYIHKNIIPDRPLFDYIDRALSDSEFYRDSNLPKSISSAVTDDIESIRASVVTHKSEITTKLEQYQKTLDGSIAKIEGEMQKFSIKSNAEISTVKETVNSKLDGFKASLDAESSKMQNTVDCEIKQFKTEIKAADTKVEDAVKRSISSENFLKGFSIFAIISILISCVSFWWSVATYNKDSELLKDALYTIELQQSEYDEMKSDYDSIIQELINRIDALENEMVDKKD